MAGFGESEIEIAGGLRGKPIKLVRSETNDIMVPAHAEMIIEGEVPLDQAEDEGPYGEMYGYLGLMKRDNFFVNITAITHRRDPLFFNSFTGVAADMPKGPSCAAEYHRYSKLIPNLKAIYSPRGANGVSLVSIDKRFPGEGMSAGQAVAANAGLNKVVIVVDKDGEHPQAPQHPSCAGRPMAAQGQRRHPANADAHARSQYANHGYYQQDDY